MKVNIRKGNILTWSELAIENKPFDQINIRTKLIAINEKTFLIVNPVNKQVVEIWKPTRKVQLNLVDKTTDVFGKLYITSSVFNDIENVEEVMEVLTKEGIKLSKIS